MAQGSYLSTYRTYKAGTKRLTTWLVQAAKLCGVDITPSTTDKYQIPIAKFVDLAQTITLSKDPKIEVPQEIVTIIRTVIALRTEAGVVLAKLTGKSINHSSNASHRYFISILDQVLGILAPHSQSSGKQSQATIEPRLVNIFEALQVEEPLLDSEATKPSSSKKKATLPLTQEYEIEDSPSDGSLFAVLGFLKDYAEMEKMAMQTWTHYRLGRLDLMTASVTADTAYGIIRRSSEDLLSSLPGQKTYSDICDRLANAEFQEEGHARGAMSLKLAQYLAKPTESLLSSFVDICPAKGMPVYNGRFGHYDAAGITPDTTPQEQHQRNMTLLLEYLPEVVKLSRASMPFPSQDEMTAGLRVIFDANNGMNGCPMYTIFATKMFLGIHLVLGADGVNPSGELQATATRCVSNVDTWLNSLKDKKLADWPNQNNDWLRQMKTFVQEWVQQDRIGGFQNKVFGRANFNHAKPLPFLSLKRNPVACGLLTLRVNLWLQEAGQLMVGTWGFMISPIHLYNACRQSAELNVEWEDV